MTTITGQVFIVTKGADSIKLGDVEVLLLEKLEVTNFLSGKMAAIAVFMKRGTDARIAKHNREVATAEANLLAAQIQLTNAVAFANAAETVYGEKEADYETFLASPNFLTNTVYQRFKKHLNLLLQQRNSETATIATLQQQSRNATVALADARNRSSPASYYSYNSGAAAQAAQQERQFLNSYADSIQNHETALASVNRQINYDQEQINLIEENAGAFKIGKIQEAAAQWTNAALSVEVLRQSLERAELNLSAVRAKPVFDQGPPDVSHFFSDFQPKVMKRTTTNPDGQFSFTYPAGKKYTIFAQCRRLVFNKTEKYYWLIDAPNSPGKLQLFLSNNNLVYFDPDNYLQIRPLIDGGSESEENL